MGTHNTILFLCVLEMFHSKTFLKVNKVTTYAFVYCRIRFFLGVQEGTTQQKAMLTVDTEWRSGNIRDRHSPSYIKILQLPFFIQSKLSEIKTCHFSPLHIEHMSCSCEGRLII